MLDTTEWMLITYLGIIGLVIGLLFYLHKRALNNFKKEKLKDLEYTEQFILKYIEKQEDIESVKDIFNKRKVDIKKVSSTNELLTLPSFNISDTKIYNYIPPEKFNGFATDYLKHLEHKLIKIKERT